MRVHHHSGPLLDLGKVLPWNSAPLSSNLCFLVAKKWAFFPRFTTSKLTGIPDSNLQYLVTKTFLLRGNHERYEKKIRLPYLEWLISYI